MLCGNSEVEQQVAMLGLDPELGRGELFGELAAGGRPRPPAPTRVYVPSAPCGGDLPFRTDRGVANYFGVGAYLRPLADARRAGVRFASECLAFANVPNEAAVEALLGEAPADAAVGGPRWKAGVPRDVGSGWDFDDVRDHYLRTLFGVDPGELRSVDRERYLELSRAVSGEVMAEVFGEWRRAGSPCGGGIVLWLRDLVPGAGWGLLDHRGEPKVAYPPPAPGARPGRASGPPTRVSAASPSTSPTTGPSRSGARCAWRCTGDFEQRLDEASEIVELLPHETAERNVETLLGRFVDVAWAYRFGPPAQDLIVASLERDRDGIPELVSQAMRFPAGRPLAAEPAARLGLEAVAARRGDGSALLTVSSRRLAYGVRVHAPGFAADDDAFSIEPGAARQVVLRPREPGASLEGAGLTALNLAGRIRPTTAEDAAR